MLAFDKSPVSMHIIWKVSRRKGVMVHHLQSVQKHLGEMSTM